MRVLIFGGRDFNDEAMMKETLASFEGVIGKITYVIQGCASGADSMGAKFAREHLLVPDSGDQFEADWKNLDVPGAVVRKNRWGGRYNAVAGHHRNQRMIDEGKPDWGIRFPGGTGTADMSKRLLRAGIPVW